MDKMEAYFACMPSHDFREACADMDEWRASGHVKNGSLLSKAVRFLRDISPVYRNCNTEAVIGCLERYMQDERYRRGMADKPSARLQFLEKLKTLFPERR